jgi:hypothetical protein
MDVCVRYISEERILERRCLPPPDLRTETDPVYETLCWLEYRMMDNAPKNAVIPSVNASPLRFKYL